MDARKVIQLTTCMEVPISCGCIDLERFMWNKVSQVRNMTPGRFYKDYYLRLKSVTCSNINGLFNQCFPDMSLSKFDGKLKNFKYQLIVALNKFKNLHQ